MNKMKSFVKEVVAIISGDNAEATGQKILRQADSALKTQIASLSGRTISLEDNVEDAKESLRLAKLNNGKVMPTELDRNCFVEELLNAKNKVTDCEEALEVHLAKIAFLQEVHDSLDK